MKKMTKDQSRDTGMAMVLLLLILHFTLERDGFVTAAVAVLVLTMTFPQLFRPVAFVWIGLSHIIGTVMSKVLLSAVFFLIVTPMGVLRSLIGKDSLKLGAFKASRDSVMLKRNHTFSAKDLERPF